MQRVPVQFWYGVVYAVIVVGIAVGMFTQHGFLLGSLTTLILFNQGSTLMSQVKANAITELMAMVWQKQTKADGVDHQAATGRSV